jgi:hypothetical protein
MSLHLSAIGLLLYTTGIKINGTRYYTLRKLCLTNYRMTKMLDNGYNTEQLRTPCAATW